MTGIIGGNPKPVLFHQHTQNQTRPQPVSTILWIAINRIIHHISMLATTTLFSRLYLMSRTRCVQLLNAIDVVWDRWKTIIIYVPYFNYDLLINSDHPAYNLALYYTINIDNTRWLNTNLILRFTSLKWEPASLHHFVT